MFIRVRDVARTHDGHCGIGIGKNESFRTLESLGLYQDGIVAGELVSNVIRRVKRYDAGWDSARRQLS
ncbi:hypothetical protein VTO73DRAFT_4179 [Trametes versicolor]